MPIPLAVHHVWKYSTFQETKKYTYTDLNPIWTGKSFPVNLEAMLSCQLESHLCHSAFDALRVIHVKEKKKNATLLSLINVKYKRKSYKRS